ncbi:MAG: ABC transporter permease subunit [Gemmataceae bacterium]|nr:ABC transporter permease subunit [Gemmataceae bacterium]MCI0742820.1 ABC transporter permease subunit [Gemmataceae bacterium]
MTPEAAFEHPRTMVAPRQAQQDPAWVRWSLTLTALAVVGVLIVIPVVHVFAQALVGGLRVYWDNLFADPDTRHSILLTLTVVPIAVGANLVFGLAAAWAIARFRFPGRTLLIALIDLPFSVSPVVAGLMFVLIFGLQGYLGPFLRADGYAVFPYLFSILGAGLFALLFFLLRPVSPKARHGLWNRPWLMVILGSGSAFGVLLAWQLYFEVWPRNESLKIIFATPGLILATAFVTFPFVARELIPVMEAIGADEETAAVSLGANGWQMFWHVTLPNIKWGLAYGLILCNARAMGEFGAVYVVSGHIAGQTDTMPLRIEKLFQEYNLPGSFAVASVLTLLALVTLVIKAGLERKVAGRPLVARHAAPKNSNGAKL